MSENTPRLPRPLSHAYLLTGGSECSRRAFAGSMAQAYVCGEEDAPCGRCRDCKKAAEGIHPDVTQVAPAEGKREIVVDQARALRSDAYIRPNEASRKVYVINPADALNPAAQNTLLKVLEEGPPYAAFLLITGRPGELLDTLRSRCETLTLPPEEEGRDPALAERARTLADLLLGDDELALLSFLTGAECAKLKSAEVLDLYDCTGALLGEQLRRSPRRAASALALLRGYRAMRPYNVGAGHLLAGLCAAWGEGRGGAKAGIPPPSLRSGTPL